MCKRLKVLARHEAIPASIFVKRLHETLRMVNVALAIHAKAGEGRSEALDFGSTETPPEPQAPPRGSHKPTKKRSKRRGGETTP